MWIKKVTLHEIGPHIHFEQQLELGLIGLMGPNGSGKSTITDSIYTALTGKWDRFPGVKTDNIRDTAEPDEPSWVEIEAVHEGTEFTIRRSLRPNSQSLKIKGEKPVTKAGDIQAKLRELGVDDKLIGSYVFVPQWAMFDFISQTPGVRAEAYQRLCKTEKAQQIVDAVDKMLEVDTHLQLDIFDNSDDIRAEIGRLTKERAGLKKESDLTKLFILSAEKKQELQQVVDQWQTKQQAQKTLQEVRQRRATASVELKSKRAAEEKLNESFQEQQERAKNLQDQIAAAKDLGLAWDQYQDYLSAKKHFQSRIDQNEKARAEDKEPHVVDPALLNHRSRELTLVGAAVERLQHIVAHFREEGVTECETCGTPVAEIDLEAKQQELEQKLAERDQADAQLAVLLEEQKTRTEWERRERDRELTVSKATASLKALKRVTKPQKVRPDTARLTRWLNTLDVVKGQMEETGEALKALQTAIGKLGGQISVWTEQQETAKDTITNISVTETSAATARSRMQKSMEAEATYRAIQQQGKQLRLAREAKEEELAELTRKLEQGARKRAFVLRLKQIKEIFHRQRLPRLVARENLEDMEGGINAALEQFGDPFFVEATEDLSFNVYFPGEPPKTAERLSGGQKGVLAVAFRSEVARLFAAELGMMVLDEPTAGMDTYNVSCLEAALRAYAAEVRGQNQVIMITHSEQLRSAFDQVIELTGNG